MVDTPPIARSGSGEPLKRPNGQLGDSVMIGTIRSRVHLTSELDEALECLQNEFWICRAVRLCRSSDHRWIRWEFLQCERKDYDGGTDYRSLRRHYLSVWADGLREASDVFSKIEQFAANSSLVIFDSDDVEYFLGDDRSVETLAGEVLLPWIDRETRSDDILDRVED